MSTFTTDRADSGEVRKLDDLGTEPTRDLREHREDTGDDPTRNLAEYARELQYGGFTGFRRPEATANRVVDLEDTVTYLLPDHAAAQPVAPLERVLGSLAAVRADLDGDLTSPSGPATPPPPEPLPPLRPAVPKKSWREWFPATAPKGYTGRHRHPGDVHAEPGALPTLADLARIAEPEPEPWVSGWFAVVLAIAVSAGMVAGVYFAARAVLAALGVFQ